MAPLDIARIEGPRLVLRLVQPGDAEYIHQLRTNPAYNIYLSAVRGTVEDQRQWIESYKKREEKNIEFYYIIEHKNGTSCGAVRLYDIDGESFTWGSWILDENKNRKSALESAYLIYHAAFVKLSLSFAQFKVNKMNETTVSFHKGFGARETHSVGGSVCFVYTRAQYEADQGRFAKLLGASRRIGAIL